MKSNHEMYKEVQKMYAQDKNLSAESVAKIFDVHSRTELDLQNLREYLTAITLALSNDVLIAQVKKDSEQEKVARAKYELNCELLVLIVASIDLVGRK